MNRVIIFFLNKIFLGIFHPFPEENFEKRIIYWHVARLIGWGHDSSNRFYWIAINSWGTEWGENGNLFEIFYLKFFFRSLQNRSNIIGKIWPRIRSWITLKIC